MIYHVMEEALACGSDNVDSNELRLACRGGAGASGNRTAIQIWQEVCMDHKIGIIGYGGMAGWHHENVERIEGLQVTAAYDIVPNHPLWN